MSKRKLRVGIVGCGGVAAQHAAAYRGSRNIDLAVVCDVSRKAADAMAGQTGARSVARLEDVIEEGVDAVSICTPPGVHLENCRPFLRSGIPVLCEKPLEAELAKAKRLAAEVRNSGTLFMAAFCHRFHRPIMELKRLIDAGTLGRPRHFRNIFSGHRLLKRDHRSVRTLSGGGTMIDNCSHSVDLFRYLVGEATRVHCMIGNIEQQGPVEDFCLLSLSAGGKAFGEITSSHSFPVGTSQVEWYGSAGTAVAKYWDDLVYQVAGGEWITVPSKDGANRFATEIEHFLDCVRRRRRPSVDVEDGLRASRIIDAAYRSASARREIVLRRP